MLKERVFKVVSQVMNVPREEIHEDSSPDTIETWDSLRHINFVLALEEEFEVQFTDRQIMNMTDLKLVIDTIEKMARQRI